MRLRDPRGNKSVNTTNDQTGTASIGGLMDIAGTDLGNGTAALATINVTRTPLGGAERRYGELPGWSRRFASGRARA